MLTQIVGYTGNSPSLEIGRRRVKSAHVAREASRDQIGAILDYRKSRTDHAIEIGLAHQQSTYWHDMKVERHFGVPAAKLQGQGRKEVGGQFVGRTNA